jgi:hypothetical protein
MLSLHSTQRSPLKCARILLAAPLGSGRANRRAFAAPVGIRAFEFLPRRSIWSEAAGRCAHMKCVRIWLYVNRDSLTIGGAA